MAQLNIGTKNALETRGPTGHSQKTTRRETKPEIVSILNTTLKLRQIELEDKPEAWRQTKNQSCCREPL